MTARPTINVLLTGVGGQGVVLASYVLSQVAMSEGYDVKQSEVHGMAQRGGSVTSHFRFGDKVWSPLVPQGTADLLMAFEALEGLRYVSWLKPGGSAGLQRPAHKPQPGLGRSGHLPGGHRRPHQGRLAQHQVRQCQRLWPPRPARSRRPTWPCWARSRRACPSRPTTWEAVIRKAVPPKTVDVNLAGLPAGRGERGGAGRRLQDLLARETFPDQGAEVAPDRGDLRTASSDPRPAHTRRPCGQKASYRWVVLGMGFLAVFGALGFGRFGYSAILPAMQKDLGISSAAAGSLASWNLAGYMVMAALGGLLASRFGAASGGRVSGRWWPPGAWCSRGCPPASTIGRGRPSAHRVGWRRGARAVGGSDVLVVRRQTAGHGLGDSQLGQLVGSGHNRTGGAGHHRRREA